jgi:peptide/nickel transport system substrate-binding protein
LVKKRLLLIPVALLLAMSTVAMGCPRPPVPVVVPPVDEPVIGGTLIWALTSDTDFVDPARVTSTSGWRFVCHFVESLFFMTAEGKVIPHLATGYEVSEDGLVWTIHLREGVRFHDGTPFNAEAAAFTLNRFLDPAMKAIYRALLLGPVTEVRVVGEYTIEIHTHTKFGPLLTNLTHVSLGMVSPTATKAAGPIGTILEAPVGTGPFKFKEWIPGDRMVMVRNDDYWDGAPYLDKVIFKVVPEAATRAMMLMVGEAHITTLTPLDAKKLAPDPEIDVRVTTGWTTRWLAVNHLVEPFNDVRVRRAIRYAINWREMVDYILMGVGTVADAPVAPGVFGYIPIREPVYDPERARHLLAEAGFPDGFSAHFLYPPGIYLMMDEIALAWQADLAAVGIDITMEVMAWGAYLKFLTAQDPARPETWVDMWKLSWTVHTGDADHLLFPVFHSANWAPVGPNRHFFKHPRVDELLALGRSTLDMEARLEIYEEAMTILMDEHAVILGYFAADSEGTRANVRGVVFRPSWLHVLTRAWIAD